MDTSDENRSPAEMATPKTVAFRDALLFWLRLGFISFGGPAGQIAIMHTELVERRRWISERRFMHALNYCMVLPGPEAQQLATYIGWLLHGTWGGIVAGGLFILPAFFLLMALSALYVTYGQLPAVAAALDGIKPVVVAIVLAAVIRIGGRAIRNGVLLAFAIASFIALAVFQLPFPLIVVSAGLLGWLASLVWPWAFAGGGHASSGDKNKPHLPAVIDDHDAPPPHARPDRRKFGIHLATGLVLWLAPVVWLWWNEGLEGPFTRMAIFFSTAALVTFGGAYAVLPYVAQQAVENFRWLRAPQMIDGLALGETTPGPLIMVVSFVGFVGGWQATPYGWAGAIAGCTVATYFTFLPSFLFILLGAPFIEQMRDEIRLTAILSGITAAVVGVILNLALFFGRAVFLPHLPAEFELLRGDWSTVLSAGDSVALLMSTAAFVALVRYKLSLFWLVALGALTGIVRRFFS